MATTELDLRDLRCPLPVLRTKKALRTLSPGSLLIVRCTDPLAAIDIPHALWETGDTLAATARDGDVLVFTIQKSVPTGPRS